ncbi:hypothetical protein Tco_0049985 [Tanacetum coccineum]
MPPIQMRRAAVEQLVVDRVAVAIAEYELNRANAGGNAGGNDGGNVGGDAGGNARGDAGCNVGGNSGDNVGGAVGLSRWIEKLESVFQISKCANEDKVKYGACTLQGRDLTWWNGNVSYLGIDAANQIAWIVFKQMMTDEYCLRNKLQRMEHEL